MAVTVEVVQAGGFTAAQDRMGRGALLTKGAGAAQVRTGLLPFDGTEGLSTAAVTPDMTTTTPPFQAVIADSAGGAYIFTNDSSVTLTHTPSNATNPRVDLVIARVYDNEAGDAAPTTPLTLPGTAGTAAVQTFTGKVEIVPGVAAATPLTPALPNARCIILRKVTVRAGATSIVAGDLSITGRATSSVAVGGVLPVTGDADLPANPGRGQTVDHATRGQLRWTGTEWRNTGAVVKFFGNVTLDASGFATVPHGLGYTPAAVAVTPSSPISAAAAAQIFASAMADSFGPLNFRVRGLYANGAAVVGNVNICCVFG